MPRHTPYPPSAVAARKVRRTVTRPPATDVAGLQFVVYGMPSPQSGMKPGGRNRNGSVRLVSTGGVGLAMWRSEVTAAAMKAKNDQRHPGFPKGPLVVQARFRFPMPQSRPKWMRTEGEWPKDTIPDLDKLQRALGDSLKAGAVIGDDGQIVEWRASKVEVWQQWTGAVVLIKSALTTSEVDE